MLNHLAWITFVHELFISALLAPLDTLDWEKNRLPLRLPQVFFRQTDGRMFSSGQGWCWKRAFCCSTHIQGTQTCNDAVTWTTGECLRRFVLRVCLHFACLVIFSWMPSQQAIQRLRSGFHQPETSHTHAEMLWHGSLYLNTMDRSVWCAFTLLFIVLAIQHSRGGSNASKKLCTCHLIFQHIFLATIPSSRPVGGSPRIENIAYNSDIILENSRQ